MSGDEKDLRNAACDLRNASTFLAGMAAGVDYAADLLGMDGSSPDDSSTARTERASRRSEYRGQREKTQRPILDIMRDLREPVTVTDLMRTLRDLGLDPLRPTVNQVMQRLVSRGLAKQVGHRYQLVRDGEVSDDVADELAALLPPPSRKSTATPGP